MILSVHLFFSSQPRSHKIELTFLTRAVRSWTKSFRRLCRVCSSRDWKRRLWDCHWSGRHLEFRPHRAPDHPGLVAPMTQTAPTCSASPPSRPWCSPTSPWLSHHIYPSLQLSQHCPQGQRLGAQTMNRKPEQSLLIRTVLNRTSLPSTTKVNTFSHKNS